MVAILLVSYDLICSPYYVEQNMCSAFRFVVPVWFQFVDSGVPAYPQMSIEIEMKVGWSKAVLNGSSLCKVKHAIKGVNYGS